MRASPDSAVAVIDRRMLVYIGGFALLLAIVCPAASFADAIPTPTSTSICELPGYQGTAIYNKYCGAVVARVPTGPSQAELQQQHDAQDTQEASDYAWDNGVVAFNKADYAGAVKDFTEALSYTPDDPDLQHNLQRAQQRLNDQTAALQHEKQIEQNAALQQQKLNEKNAALQQALIVQHNSVAATGTGNNNVASYTASVGIDRGGAAAANPAAATVDAGANSKYDPVVPEAKRTPKITALEKQRMVERARLEKLHGQLKAADPKADPVKLSKLKQSETTVEHKIQYLNLSISAELDKPAATDKKLPPP